MKSTSGSRLMTRLLVLIGFLINLSFQIRTGELIQVLGGEGISNDDRSDKNIGPGVTKTGCSAADWRLLLDYYQGENIPNSLEEGLLKRIRRRGSRSVKYIKKLYEISSSINSFAERILRNDRPDSSGRIAANSVISNKRLEESFYKYYKIQMEAGIPSYSNIIKKVYGMMCDADSKIHYSLLSKNAMLGNNFMKKFEDGNQILYQNLAVVYAELNEIEILSRCNEKGIEDKELMIPLSQKDVINTFLMADLFEGIKDFSNLSKPGSLTYREAISISDEGSLIFVNSDYLLTVMSRISKRLLIDLDFTESEQEDIDKYEKLNNDKNKPKPKLSSHQKILETETDPIWLLLKNLIRFEFFTSGYNPDLEVDSGLNDIRIIDIFPKTTSGLVYHIKFISVVMASIISFFFIF